MGEKVPDDLGVYSLKEIEEGMEEESIRFFIDNGLVYPEDPKVTAFLDTLPEDHPLVIFYIETSMEDKESNVAWANALKNGRIDLEAQEEASSWQFRRYILSLLIGSYISSYEGVDPLDSVDLMSTSCQVQIEQMHLTDPQVELDFIDQAVCAIKQA